MFRFTLTTEGRAGHASIPRIGDNALLRMVAVLARLDGRQPEFDSYPAAAACLSTLLGHQAGDPAEALAEVRSIDGRLADLIEPMLGVTVSPDDDRGLEEGERDPLTLLGAGRLQGAAGLRGRPRSPSGRGADRNVSRRGGYSLRFDDDVVGNISALEGPLAEAIDSFVQENDPGAAIAPLVLSGFTDSHWFRKAFPECVAYGFFPQHAMTLYETTPLIHAPDERIAVDDLVFASSFYYELAAKAA